MKYWVYIDGQVPGSFTAAELSSLRGFTSTSLVCPAEGEVQEKNWRISAEIPEIASLLKEAEPAVSQPAMEEPARPSLQGVTPTDLDKFLDDSGRRLFRHVGMLMSDLAREREERAQNTALRRQLSEMKSALNLALEKSSALAADAGRAKELQASLTSALAEVKTLGDQFKVAEASAQDMRMKLEVLSNELDGAKKRQTETADNLAVRNRLVDKLNGDLAEKELTLAKSIALISRMEQELGSLYEEPSGENEESTAASTEPDLKSKQQTAPEALKTPVAPENPAQSAPAQSQRIGAFFRKYIGGSPQKPS